MRFWKLGGLLSLASCVGGSNGAQNCTANISWQAPTAREDNSLFTVEEIQHYDLFIGKESGVYYRIVKIEDQHLRSWQESNLKGGSNYFTMTVTDIDGLESNKADEIVKFVNSKCTGE